MKEKQIEEMAYNILEEYASCYSQVDKENLAEYIRSNFEQMQSKGEWIEKKRFYASGKTLVHYQCSLCGIHLATQANYCPVCGAKMKGGAE